MRYTNFQISNFKGIRDIEINLDRLPRSPVFALVGLNESGKTTILEAIHWILSPQDYNSQELIPKSELANFNGQISVIADLELSKDDTKSLSSYLNRGSAKFKLDVPIEKLSIKRVYTYKDSAKVEENFIWKFSMIGKSNRMSENKAFNNGDDWWEKVRTYFERYMLPPIIYYENFLFNFPDKIYLQAKAEKELSRQDNVYRSVIQDVLNSIDKKMRVDSHLIERHIKGGRHLKSLESVLTRLGSKISNQIFNLWRELLKTDEDSGLEIIMGHGVQEDEKGYYLEVKIKDGDQNFHIRERSLGFRWFFSFILFTHFRSFRYEHYRKALFLLDEPASNLHPSAQAKILHVFEEFPNKQDVIYATHSHHMINPKWLSGTFVVKNETMDYKELNGSYHSHMTEITAKRYFQFIASYPGDTDYFRPILDCLDYRLSQLEYAPELIIVEGKNDFYTLKYLKEMGFIETEFGDHIFPSTGKDKMDYLIGLYLAWGRKFVVILDDDRGGRNTYNRMKRDFGSIMDDRLFKLGDVEKDWSGFTMESLFLDSDYPKIIQSVYPEETTYEKSKFNIALQNCWLIGHKIDLHKYTIKRFKKLFDFLEDKLESIDNQLLG